MNLEYKGYTAKVELDESQQLFHGEVNGTTDVITFAGKTAVELVDAFHDSVDDYLAFCRERGETPEKPYSGRFVVRVSPELHRSISIAARRSDLSMNEWIAGVLARAIKQDAESVGAS